MTDGIQGEQGEPGERGEQGEQGEHGERGRTGAAGGADVVAQGAEILVQLQELSNKTGASDATQKRVEKTERRGFWQWVSIIGLTLTILVDVPLTVLYVRSTIRIDKYATITAALTKQVHAAECSLNTIFVGAYKPKPTLQPGQTIEQYNAAFKKIIGTYRDLGCLPKLPDGFGP